MFDKRFCESNRDDFEHLKIHRKEKRVSLELDESPNANKRHRNRSENKYKMNSCFLFGFSHRTESQVKTAI